MKQNNASFYRHTACKCLDIQNAATHHLGTSQKLMLRASRFQTFDIVEAGKCYVESLNSFTISSLKYIVIITS